MDSIFVSEPSYTSERGVSMKKPNYFFFSVYSPTTPIHFSDISIHLNCATYLISTHSFHISLFTFDYVAANQSNNETSYLY